MKVEELHTKRGEGAVEPPGGVVAEGEEVFARGSAAEHPFGVLYQGEWETPWDGTAAAVRLHARALADAGVPLLLKSFSNMVTNAEGIPEPVHLVGVSDEVVGEVGHVRETSISRLGPLIKHVVVRDAEHLRAVIVPRGLVCEDPQQLVAMRDGIYRATILYTVWERDRIEPDVARHLSRAAQCWVPCSHNKATLQAAGVPARQVHVVPHPYHPADPMCRLVERHGYDSRLFYSIGRWEPRKGYHKLIGAFLTAFGADEPVGLMIKYSGGDWEGYPTPRESVSRWLQDQRVVDNGWTIGNAGRRLKLISGKLPRDQIVKLHFASNVYVSSSHGEAWNLPAFEAKLAGNSMVHVPYGGTVDFEDPERDVRVPFELGAVDPSYRWPAGCKWATFSVAALAAALKRAVAPDGPQRPPEFEQRFRMDHVGQQMRELVLGVARGYDGKVAKYLSDAGP
jgi:glycosyltransferase involved in cell wall biosynthesis